MTMTKRSTAVGVFHDRSRAEEAYRALRQAGFSESQISIISKGRKDEVQTEGSKAAEGAAAGAVAGGGVAALVSLGMSFGVIPVIGPILALGPLAAALLSAAGGAAAAGLVGALIGLGIPEHEAKYYESEVGSGRTLVTVRADSRYDDAWAILNRFGAYNHETASTSATCATAGATGATRTEGGQTIKVHEEQLHARKTPVEAGEARVRKEVVTETKTLNVPVQREEVVIERRPVSGHASSSDIRPGEEIRIPVKEEQVRVEKEAVVKEEVHVGKRKVQENEQVSGTVRKEQVKIEQKGDVNVRGNIEEKRKGK